MLILCMFSCTVDYGEHYVRYNGFPEEIMLKAVAETVQPDTVFLRYPFRIAVRDSLAVVMDLHNTDYYFHAFTYPDWKYVAAFGRRGEGPEEMLSAETFRFLSYDSLWALDANRQQISRWRISPVERSAERLEVIDLDKSLVRTLDFCVTDDGFIVPDYLGAFRYHRLSPQGETIRSEGDIPTEKKRDDGSRPALAQAWRSFVNFHPRRDILVMATQLGETLEIFHLKDSVRTVVYGPYGEPEFRIVQNESIPIGIMGFSDVCVTDSFIYAVFHGRTFRDIQAVLQKGEPSESGGRSIYVFDLNGKPARKYTLDRAIYGINVDEQKRIITATDVNHDEQIIRFEI
ncbi:MAG: TolB-like 6-bladed beta-propeller domain-containing protein [Tannerella sp.]|nr:TolB-like 6-bladed beta-propeller domain-containing protein [Tannerella sp.]